MNRPAFTFGLDYGTNSVRCLVVDISDGSELSRNVHEYPSREQGVLLDLSDDKLARLNPADYHVSTESAIKGAIREVCKVKKSFDASRICAFGGALAGAVVAGENDGGYDRFTDAQNAM